MSRRIAALLIYGAFGATFCPAATDVSSAVVTIQTLPAAFSSASTGVLSGGRSGAGHRFPIPGLYLCKLDR